MNIENLKMASSFNLLVKYTHWWKFWNNTTSTALERKRWSTSPMLSRQYILSEFLNESLMQVQVLLRLISKEIWAHTIPQSNNKNDTKIIKISFKIFPECSLSPIPNTYTQKLCRGSKYASKKFLRCKFFNNWTVL